MTEPINLDERRVARAGNFDGTDHMACRCGNVWWKCPGVVVNADTGAVEGYAYPLVCVECGFEYGGLPA